MSSNPANAFDSPGGNRPDDLSDGPNADPSALRSDAGVGGEVVAGTEKDDAAVRTDAPAVNERTDANVDLGRTDKQEEAGNVQDEPAMDMHDATTREKIRGIVAQTRADFPRGSDPATFEHALSQRFRDTGIDVSDDQIRKLAAE